MLRALVVLLLVASPLLAQDSPHVGTWKITFPVGMRIEGGSATPTIGTGTLTVERVSDSLIGTLVTDPIPDAEPRPNMRMATAVGTAADATFTSTTTGMVTAGIQEFPITSTSIWKLQVKGDSLVGTLERRISMAGMPMPGPQPVSGVRVK